MRRSETASHRRPAQRVRVHAVAAALLAGLLTGWRGVQAQSRVQGSAQATTPQAAACPTPEQIEPIHLYGLWQADVEGTATKVSVRFDRHTELTGSVMGLIQRNGVKSQCAGDVDNGVLALEESSDGKSITATWTGTVVAGSCGKEISGTWNNFNTKMQHKFVLRKASGWD